MEKGKRIEVMNREIQLPEAIIQHIQSFLDAKQAAQTSILSISWHNAWLTRPNLVFDERNFQNPDPKSPVSHSFSEFATNTLVRHEKMNLKIENFRLWMDFRKGENRSLADELMAKVLKIGVFNLHLKFRLPDSLVITPLFELRYKNVARLSVTHLDGSVGCSRHKPLVLSRQFSIFYLVSYEMSKDRSVEKLFTYECGCLAEVKKTTRAVNLYSKRQHLGSSMFHY